MDKTGNASILIKGSTVRLTKILMSALFLVHASATALSEIKTLENGDQISWDGNYYDFRDSAGVQMIKLWIPPDVKIVRGIFISGHGGGGGDSRQFARDENIRAFAMRLGFGVAGLHNFPGRQVYEKGAKVFFRALTEFSKIGGHPEIANVPFVIYGSSNGGATAYGFINYAPERAICFTANVSAGGNPAVPVDAALKVPGIFIMGKFDALIGKRGINRTDSLMKAARPRGALWAWALELKGHEDGYSFDYYAKLVEQAISLRYPNTQNPSQGPVKLNEIKEENGWLVGQNNWDRGPVKIASYLDYKGDKSLAGWVLNKDMAYIYRSLATHHNPLAIKVTEFDRTYNPNTNPGTMFSLGGPVADPGAKVTLVCDTKKFPDWETIEFFNGSYKLGHVNAGAKPQLSIVLDSSCLVYCPTLLATAKSGLQATCDPIHFFVKDPNLDWKDRWPKQVFSRKREKAGSRNSGKIPDSTAVKHEDGRLIAYGLNAGMERQFSATDNKCSDFWNLIDDSRDVLKLTQRNNASPSAAFNGVLSHDCNMNVKAAYGSDGLYLLFEINDDNDAAWPNALTGTEDEQFYHNFDAVDVMMDSRSIAQICRQENQGLFLSKGWGLTLTTKQYQLACGTPDEKAAGFRRSLPSPWDMNAAYISFDDAKNRLGIEVENIRVDYYYKSMELFIPWSEYDAGFDAEPEAGTALGFSAGYNDRDEGEHFPPGVTSSGGSVKASNALRWVDRTDPWNKGPANSQPPYAWGEIVLGPMLDK